MLWTQGVERHVCMLRGSSVSLGAAETTAPLTQLTPSRRVVIPALGFAQILAWGSSYYLPAVLAPSVAEEMHWPLTWIIGGLSLGMLVGGIASRRIGRAIHEHGGRPILAASSVLIA